MSLAPIEMALERTSADLEIAAEADHALSQYALAIVLSHGLNGTARDISGAETWRSRAVASRGYQPITQYTAAFDGAPSRVNIINVPRYDLAAFQVELIERCIQTLQAGTATIVSCGTGADILKAKWASASR